MPTDGRPLKWPLIQNFVVSSEVVKKTSKKSDPLFSSFIVPLLFLVIVEQEVEPLIGGVHSLISAILYCLHISYVAI